MSGTLESRFHAAMVDLYYACAARLKPPYYAARFLAMVQAVGGKAAADHLLAAPAPSPAFVELSRRDPATLRLTVEYRVLEEPWCPLFTAEQLAIARARLLEAGGELPEGRREAVAG